MAVVLVSEEAGAGEPPTAWGGKSAVNPGVWGEAPSQAFLLNLLCLNLYALASAIGAMVVGREFELSPIMDKTGKNIAGSNRGPWHLSLSNAMSVPLPNAEPNCSTHSNRRIRTRMYSGAGRRRDPSPYPDPTPRPCKANSKSMRYWAVPRLEDVFAKRSREALKSRR